MCVRSLFLAHRLSLSLSLLCTLSVPVVCLRFVVVVVVVVSGLFFILYSWVDLQGNDTNDDGDGSIYYLTDLVFGQCAIE